MRCAFGQLPHKLIRARAEVIAEKPLISFALEPRGFQQQCFGSTECVDRMPPLTVRGGPTVAQSSEDRMALTASQDLSHLSSNRTVAHPTDWVVYA